MSAIYNCFKEKASTNAFRLSVEDQYQLAKSLAANCGYQLIAEDTERSLEIKELKNKINRGYGGLPVIDRQLLIEGLEALLK